MSLRIIPLQPASLPVQLSCYPSASCGWPSPAADYAEPPLSLDELVDVRAPSSCLIWVTDDALSPSGICPDDLLVADKAMDPQPGDIVLAYFDGEHYLRRLAAPGQAPALLAEQPGISPMIIGVEQSVEITAVVTWNLHRQPGATTPAGFGLSGIPASLDEVVKVKACSTFLARASGKSMVGAGIRPHDILVVDRACDPRSGYIVVAIVDGEFTVKRLGSHQGEPALIPENDSYAVIPLQSKYDPALWGTVTWNLQKLIQR